MKPKEDFVIGGAIVFVVSVILIFLGGVLGYLTIVAYVVYLLTMVTLTARLARSKKRFYRILAYILCLPLFANWKKTKRFHSSRERNVV
jgi:hypothetical protein